VNAGFVCKGISADDGLVGLNHKTGQLRNELAGSINLPSVDAGGQIFEEILTGVDGHDDFFKCGITGPLTDAVDCALDLSGAAFHTGQGVGCGHSEVVVAMGTDDDTLDTFDVLLNVGDDLTVFAG